MWSGIIYGKYAKEIWKIIRIIYKALYGKFMVLLSVYYTKHGKYNNKSYIIRKIIILYIFVYYTEYIYIYTLVYYTYRYNIQSYVQTENPYNIRGQVRSRRAEPWKKFENIFGKLKIILDNGENL